MKHSYYIMIAERGLILTSLLSQQGCVCIYSVWEKVNKFVFMLKKTLETIWASV